jgi:uncharacterized protein (TIGR03118 family)
MSTHRWKTPGRQSILALALMLFMAPTPWAAENAYEVHTLVSDLPGVADHQDPNLVNAWGIVFNPNGPVWVNDNGTGVATLYDGDGNPQSLVVTIPPPNGAPGPSAPTGIVFNNSSDFKVSPKNPAVFIFATEDGTLAAWNPVDRHKAILKVDNSMRGAVYKGLALAANGSGHFLYATDFHNATIAVFDKDFQPARLPGSFEDPAIPPGYAPFGIRNINGDLYVTYAQQDAAKHDDVPGEGHGFVDVFDANGQLIHRLASHGKLNSPWGLALAPAGFGEFSNRLLVGNFGDGAINAYDLASGEFRGQLQDADGHIFHIDGLWGLSFGNGVLDQPTDVLFFAAGPDHESHGLYGRIAPSPGPTGQRSGAESDE